LIPVQHIHPMIVHFPIVAIFLLVAFDVVATAMGKSVTGRTVVSNIATGLAVLAAGSAAAAFYFAETHEALGKYVAVFLALWALVRVVLWFRDFRFKGVSAYLVPLVTVAGTALVVTTAYFGGQLVFDLGVNVAKVAAGA
jgi:uncharacterized membrane protein